MFRKNLGFLFFLIPYLISNSAISNKTHLIISFLINQKTHPIKFSNGTVLKFPNSQKDIIHQLLAIITYSTDWSFTNKTLKISFDKKSFFSINFPINTFEEQNLLQLLYYGIRFGANFISEAQDFDVEYPRNTIKILKINGKRIVKLSNGIKFYLDSILPGITIVEAFISDVHSVVPNLNLKDKIVVDVGAQCGDTPLYYAKKGAKVYAFEPNKNHFNAMKRNLSLNPALSKNITLFDIAIGKNGYLKFFQSNDNEISGMASFVFNVHGKNVNTTLVDGLSLENALKKFQIAHVDLLKLDCKGCEFFLNKNSLIHVDRLKIEYDAHLPSHKLENLLNMLIDSDFEYFVYRPDPNNRLSNNKTGCIYAIKKSLKKNY